MEAVMSIIVKYWVEFLLGALVTGVGFFIKRYIKLEKADREKGQKEHYAQLKTDIGNENKLLLEEVSKTSAKEDEKLQEQVDSMKTEIDALKKGVLSMQGKEFRESCRRLLDPAHEITLDEWEDIDADHEAYNGLGGNHKGDTLFALVKQRAELTLTKNKDKKE